MLHASSDAYIMPSSRSTFLVDAELVGNKLSLALSQFAHPDLLVEDFNILHLPGADPKSDPGLHRGDVGKVVDILGLRRSIKVVGICRFGFLFAFTLLFPLLCHLHILLDKLRFALDAGHVAVERKILNSQLREMRNGVGGKS